MDVRIRIQVVDGNTTIPLRRAYVEHLVFGAPVATYRTDDQGRVINRLGNVGIDNPTPNVDIRVLCQNSVVKVLNGAAANAPIWQDFPASDGGTVTINTNAEQVNHYPLLNRCLNAYDTVFRQFRPFSAARDPDFPLGRRSDLTATKDQKKRIEVSFPDQFHLATFSFTEPKSLATQYPLVHFKQDTPIDGRLFGVNGFGPTAVPAEMAHALHFSVLPASIREQIQNDFVRFILVDCAVRAATTQNIDDCGTHELGVRTTAMVAYIEALDHFSQRFSEFVRTGQSTETGANLRRAFFRAELASTNYWGATEGFQQAGTVAGNVIAPNFTGTDVEGAVYGAIFLDFARRVGTLTAVNAYLQSRALSFGEYREWIRNHRPQHWQDIREVSDTWGL